MKLRWSPRAMRDIDAIRAYIAEDNPAAAQQWVAKLRLRAREVVQLPMAGRAVPEWAAPDIREVIVGNYRVVYRVEAAGVLILTVLEGYRQLRKE